MLGVSPLVPAGPVPRRGPFGFVVLTFDYSSYHGLTSPDAEAGGRVRIPPLLVLVKPRAARRRSLAHDVAVSRSGACPGAAERREDRRWPWVLKVDRPSSQLDGEHSLLCCRRQVDNKQPAERAEGPAASRGVWRPPSSTKPCMCVEATACSCRQPRLIDTSNRRPTMNMHSIGRSRSIKHARACIYPWHPFRRAWPVDTCRVEKP